MARTTIVFSLLLLLSVLAAEAQEKGQAGLVIGYPASVGLVWHLSGRIAVRPEVTFSRSSNETTTFSGSSLTSTSEGDGWTTAVGLSALFYVARWDATRAYVSPRFAYSRTEATSTNATLTPFGMTTVVETLNATYTTSGSIGVQYSPARKFAIFGELGFAYVDIEGSTRLSTTHVESTSRSVGTRSGVGVVLYF